MTIEELREKVEDIELPGERKGLTVHVCQKDGDIEVIDHFGDEEQRLLSIKMTSTRVPYVDIDDYLYSEDTLGVLIKILNVCHEYMKSVK